MIRVADFVSALSLRTLCPTSKEEWPIDSADTNRPGLQLAGHFDYFAQERPQVLGKAGVLEGKRFTCYPGVSLEKTGDGEWEPVVVDGRLVTSQGPGTAVAFALTLAELLEGLDVAQRVAAGMLLEWPPEEA